MRKKIAIDCSKLSDEVYTGTHRFLLGFLGEIVKNKNYEYFFYFSQFPTKLTQHRFLKLGTVKIVRVKPYTQLGLLFELPKYDYFVFPWQTIPFLSLFVKSNVVSIIHDMGFSWKTKFFTYLTVLLSNQLFSVSNTTRSQVPRSSRFLGEGVDPKIFKVLPEEELLKLDHRFGIHGGFILSIGRIEERKNIYNNLKAFKIVLDLYPKLKYLFVGKFMISEDKIYSFMKELEIPMTNVLFKKYISDEELNYYLNRCKFTIFTSLDEGFGLPVLESYRVGKPVILSNIQALAELGLTANQFVDPQNPNEIAEKIIQFLKIRNLNQRFHFEEVLNFYSWENTIKRFFEGIKN